jgi:Iap family predicted aminopeptidase
MKDFPNAFDVEWETANNLYEVDFNIQRKDVEAFYDVKGELIMYSCEISHRDLSAIVKNAAYNQYPKYKIRDVKKIFRGSQLFYKIEMEYGDLEVKLIVKNDGVIQKQWFDY